MRKVPARGITPTKGLRLAARGCGLACVAWLGGLILLAAELAHLPYSVDWPSSLVVALLLSLGSMFFWQMDVRQTMRAEQDGQRQWLKLLLVGRQDIEAALVQLTSLHSDLNELIAQSDQPQLHQIWRDVVLRTHRAESEYLQAPLESALTIQDALNTGLEELALQLRSLQIAFSHGTHQSQLIYQLHEAISALQPLLLDSSKARTSLSRASAEHQAHSRSLDALPDQPFEMWRHRLRALQKQLRRLEQSLLMGLGETITTAQSSPDLMKKLEPRGPV